MVKKIKANKTQFRAMLSPQSYNEERNTLDVTFTTEAPVMRYDWRREQWYKEVLSFSDNHVKLDRLNSGAPVLDNHSTMSGIRSQIGVVERAWVEQGQGGATIRLSGREDVKGIIQDVRDGIIKNISIGYEVRQVERQESEDDDYPTYRATDWEPFEISLVPIPADPNAQVRKAEEMPTEEIEIINEPEPIEDGKKDKDRTDVNAACLDIFITKIK